MSIEADRERISLGIKQLITDTFTDFVEANKKGARVSASIVDFNDDRIVLNLAENVQGYLPQKDYTNSLADTPLEVGAEMEVVIANIDRKDRRINLSLRALEKQEERSALQDNAQKNKQIEEATKSNIGDLIKAELGESKDKNE